MQHLQDITCNNEWLNEQTDRLLGFEVLYQELTAHSETLSPSVICEKIGVHPAFTHNALISFSQKFNTKSK
jgi:hypothetical protein